MPRIPLNMPKMSMTMEFGTVVEWALAVGDDVKNGEVLAVVTTDKVDMDVEATCDGVLAEIVAQPGDEVPVGQPMGFVDSETDDLLGGLFGAAPADAPPAEPERSPETAAEVTAEGARPAAHISAGPGTPDAPGASADASGATGDAAQTDLAAAESPAAKPADILTADRGAGDASDDRPVGDESADDQPVGDVRAVPLARRLAREAGLDLRTIAPGGPWRTIRARDVRGAIAAAGGQGPGSTPSPGADQAVPVQAAGQAQSTSTPAAPAAVAAPAAARADAPAPSAAAPADPATTPAQPTRPAPAAAASDDELLGDARSRRHRVATAQAMVPSAAVPQFTAYRTLDLTRMARARKGALSGVSWTTILLRAYALALREYPALNGFWTAAGVRRNDQVGVSLAVDTPAGLFAPVLRDPDRITIKELDRQIRRLAEDARAGRLDPSLFGGGTGTVSNLGGMGVDRFNALLTPPQATALSLGAVGLVPVFGDDGEVIARMSCVAGLTIDHRVADGADAARALHTMQEFLNDPLMLLA